MRVQGWQGLQEEMAADMRRLWLRNLGRDDRILSDQGREARHPFLHAPLQALVLGLPLPHLADFSQVCTMCTIWGGNFAFSGLSASKQSQQEPVSAPDQSRYACIYA